MRARGGWDGSRERSGYLALEGSAPAARNGAAHRVAALALLGVGHAGAIGKAVAVCMVGRVGVAGSGLGPACIGRAERRQPRTARHQPVCGRTLHCRPHAACADQAGGALATASHTASRKGRGKGQAATPPRCGSPTPHPPHTHTAPCSPPLRRMPSRYPMEDSSASTSSSECSRRRWAQA